MRLKSAAMGTPGPEAASVPGHLEVVLLFADGPHGGDRVRLARMLLHSLLPAEARARMWAESLPTAPPRTPRSSPWPAWVFLTGGGMLVKPSLAGDSDSRDIKPMLASGTAQHHRLPENAPCPPTNPDSGIRKDPIHAFVRAPRKVLPAHRKENVSDLWLYLIKVSGQSPPPLGIFRRRFSKWT